MSFFETVKCKLKIRIYHYVCDKSCADLQACRGYGYPWISPWIYPWIYPCVDMRLRPCCGYIHGYYAGTPAN